MNQKQVFEILEYFRYVRENERWEKNVHPFLIKHYNYNIFKNQNFRDIFENMICKSKTKIKN